VIIVVRRVVVIVFQLLFGVYDVFLAFANL